LLEKSLVDKDIKELIIDKIIIEDKEEEYKIKRIL
jgi:hypothetical protein